MRHAYVLLTAGLVALGACSNQQGSAPGTEPAKEPAKEANINLTGAGASFPFPLYSKWVSDYQKRDPRVRINYQSIGSGGGIRQITERTVDFGGSDAQMTPAQLAKAPGRLLHIPTTLGAVVVTYNLAGVPAGLKLTPDVLAAIFLGEIKKWNDSKITVLNPGVTFPDQAVAVVHRSDGSGTTNVFTDYLAKVSPVWREKVGVGTSVKWPTGLGGKGNEGVTGQVKTTPGTLGYVELAYAIQNKLPYAQIKNQAGQFVEPKIESITAAAAGAAANMPEELAVSITDAPGAEAYPIAAFTYVLLYQGSADRTKAEALAKFLWWAIHDGQGLAAPLHYAPLPPAVVVRVEAKLRTLTAGGTALLP
jgi:phosphate transport system substrate-binding protein